MEDQLLVSTYIHTFLLTQDKICSTYTWVEPRGCKGHDSGGLGWGKKRDTKVVNQTAFHMETRIQEINNINFIPMDGMKHSSITLLQSNEQSAFESTAFLSEPVGTVSTRDVYTRPLAYRNNFKHFILSSQEILGAKSFSMVCYCICQDKI